MVSRWYNNASVCVFWFGIFAYLWFASKFILSDNQINKHQVFASLYERSVCVAGFGGPCLPKQHAKHFEKQSYPGALIIGMKKCGTRALLSMLNSHPQVRTLQKEGHYYDNDGSYFLGNHWYRSRMPVTEKEEIVIEKTPAYAHTSCVPLRVHRSFPHIKVIALVRNPVTRLISDFTQEGYCYCWHGEVSAIDPLSRQYVVVRVHKLVNMKACEHSKFKGKTDTFHSRYFQGQNIKGAKLGVTIGRYEEHIRRWLKLFPQQTLVLDGDTFISDALPVLHKIEAFLNLTPYFTEKNIVYNATKQFYCWFDLLMSEQVCLGDSKGRKHVQVYESDKQALSAYYKPHNNALYKLLNHSFDW